MRKAILRITLLFAMVCLLSSSVFAAEVWDGSVASAFAGGSGTKDDPYLISNGAQLALVNEYNGNNTHFRLTEDIFLNDTTGWENWTAENGPSNIWTPLLSSQKFQGTLDGDGHAIYGLYVSKIEDYAGLFTGVYNATIRNLSIRQSAVFGGDEVGSLAGEATESTVENCHSDGRVEGVGARIGGLIGNAYQCRLSGCTNAGVVRNTNNIYTNNNSVLRTGGIAGAANLSTVESCINTGSVSSYGGQVGGIAGQAYSKSVFADCENRGNVTVLALDGKSPSEVGGIVGTAGDGVVVSNCKNYVDIHAEAFRVGGIAGQISAGCLVEDCKNFRAVSGKHDAGGIVGVMYDGTVDGCENNGNVSVTENNSVGGITAEVNKGLVRNCSNTGDITSPTQNCGGIAGIVWPESEGIVNCRNTGTVTGPSSLGGIVGNAINGSLVLNCLNSGAVQSTGTYYNCGAVVGRDQGCTIIHSHFVAAVSAEMTDAAKLTEITGEELRSAEFLQTLNDWVQTAQRPNTGYAKWELDATGLPVPTGTVPAYIPVTGFLTLHQPENGSAVISHTSALTETAITVTVTADTGYIPYQVWYCAEEKPSVQIYAEKMGKNTFTFAMPYGDAEVYASCLALPKNGVWDGTVAEAFAGGDGTENNPYLIGNASQLARLSNYSYNNYYYRLVADIYLNDTSNWESWTATNGPANVWTPIPSFSGTVDGDGHTIYGLYTDALKSDQGLFAYLQNNSCIQNLTIDKSKVFGTERVGAFAAMSWGKISNCINKADVFATGYNCGSFTGENGVNAVVENCINYGSVCSSNYAVGGIAGSSTGPIRGCSNYGDVTSTMNAHPENARQTLQTGGIVGQVWSTGLIADCQNYGAVSCRKAAGGIAGITSGGATVTQCTNYGTVTATVSPENESSGEMAGGITAGLVGGTISNCINNGTVVAKKYAGGICGIQDYNNDKQDGSLIKCTNQGEIRATTNNAGGIVALINSSNNIHTVEQCVNNGAVSVSTGDDGYYGGGIAGYVTARDNGTVVVRNCYNTAAVEGNWLVGGLVGQLWIDTNQSGTLLLETSYNTGAIIGTRLTSGTVGRIGARSPGGLATVRNCYSLSGTVSADVTCYGGSGTETVTNVKSLTAVQMGQQSSFTGFDFETIWLCAGDGSYPTLLLVRSSGQMGEVLDFAVYQNGAVSVTADASNGEPVYAVLVSYQDGQMKAMDMIQLNPGEEGMLALMEQGDSVMLFALSAEWVPFCANQSI